MYAIDNGKLGSALLGLLEQSLSFIEEAGVFEGDTHGVCERGQEPRVCLAECILPVHILEADGSLYFVVDDPGHDDG